MKKSDKDLIISSDNELEGSSPPNMPPEAKKSNPIEAANQEAIVDRLPFATCRKCDKYRYCPIPSMNNTTMFVPDPHKCWLETMRRDPNAKATLTRMLVGTQNRYGLLMLELDSLERTVDLLQDALDSPDISLHSKGTLSALDRKFKNRGGGRR